MDTIGLLQQLLRARSVNPPGDEGDAASILEAWLSDAGLDTEIVTSPGRRPNLIARVDGPRDRPALVLLSHSDVVPVEEGSWTHDPFGGEVADGCIWGRGALDMKSVAVMHAAAAAQLVRSGRTPTREVIVAVVADEETGGQEGARWLLDEHPNKVGFGDDRAAPIVLGEGAYGVAGQLERPVMPVAVGEKTAVAFEIKATGDPGHGALPPQNQAPVNLAGLIEAIAGFGTPRVHPVMREQFSSLAQATTGPTKLVLRALASPAGSIVARGVAQRLRRSGALGLLLSDSVTPTRMNAGYTSNVVPGEATASFDSRLLPDTDIDAFFSSITEKAERAGAVVVNINHKGRGPVSERSDLSDILEQVSRELIPDAVTTVSLSPGITDVRYFRAKGATGYGWCPVVLTPELLATIHGHDERIGIEDFERAVEATTRVVARFCG